VQLFYWLCIQKDINACFEFPVPVVKFLIFYKKLGL